MKTTTAGRNPTSRSYSVALTGGIATGKSTVAEVFHKHGAPVFDADGVARDLVQPGRPALAEIVDSFGDAMLTPLGELDRRRMRDRVFSDVAERHRLESILHPKVRAELIAAVAACAYPYCILVIPLLAEWRDDYVWADRALLVDVPFETQVVRVMRRDDVTRDAALRILAIQATREQRLAVADDVIDNAGPAGALDAAVERLHARYLALAENKVHK